MGIKVNTLQLKNGNDLKLCDCPAGCEFTESGGQRLVNAILEESLYIESRTRQIKGPILFFKPRGYRETFVLTQEIKTIASKRLLFMSNIRFDNLREKNLYRFTESKFEILIYEEYLDCHRLLRQIKEKYEC